MRVGLEFNTNLSVFMNILVITSEILCTLFFFLLPRQRSFKNILGVRKYMHRFKTFLFFFLSASQSPINLASSNSITEKTFTATRYVQKSSFIKS